MLFLILLQSVGLLFVFSFTDLSHILQTGPMNEGFILTGRTGCSSVCLDYISLNAAGRSAANDSRLGVEQRLTPSPLVVRCVRGSGRRRIKRLVCGHRSGTSRRGNNTVCFWGEDVFIWVNMNKQHVSVCGGADDVRTELLLTFYQKWKLHATRRRCETASCSQVTASRNHQDGEIQGASGVCSDAGGAADDVNFKCLEALFLLSDLWWVQFVVRSSVDSPNRINGQRLRFNKPPWILQKVLRKVLIGV